MLKRKAFTLIELLVVIAIIGILSGMIVLAMNNSTDKARVAKSQVYFNSLRTALMSNVKGDWTLDGTGENLWDHATGTITGATAATDCAQNTCYSFDGGDYILTANTGGTYSMLTSGMTAMIWVKGASQAARTVFANWDTSASYKEAWKISSNGALLRVILADTTTQATVKNYYSTTGVAFDNSWHLVGFSWTGGGGTLTLYIDGVAVTTTKTDGDGAVASLNANGATAYAPISIGCDMATNAAANFFTGSLDNARLFSAAIPTSQIQELYYAGLNNLLASGKISADEYSQRTNNLSLNK